VKSAGSWEEHSDYLSKTSARLRQIFSRQSYGRRTILAYFPYYEKLKVAYEITHLSVCLYICIPIH
jgi:hypothetical protein